MLLIVIALIGVLAAAAFAGSRAVHADRNGIAWMIARDRDRTWDWDQDR